MAGRGFDLVVAVIVGLIGGVAAFWATSMAPTLTYLGPLGLQEVVRSAGHDPLTGRPFGRIIVVSDAFMDPPVVTRRTIEHPPPDGFEQAIPVPVGWIGGSAAAYLALRRWRRRAGLRHPP